MNLKSLFALVVAAPLVVGCAGRDGRFGAPELGNFALGTVTGAGGSALLRGVFNDNDHGHHRNNNSNVRPYENYPGRHNVRHDRPVRPYQNYRGEHRGDHRHDNHHPHRSGIRYYR